MVKRRGRGSRAVARGLAASMGALGALGAGLGCAEAPGELILVMQTDMSLPEDIDTLRIEVSRDGIPRYEQDFPSLGTDTGIKLPATIGIVPNEEAPSASAQIRVSARAGGVVRAVREVITQVPEGRVATLHVPIEFLCLGSAEPQLDGEGNVVGVCPDGTTCEAGVCRRSELEEDELEALPEYASNDVFGDPEDDPEKKQKCLDVALCFTAPRQVAIDQESCTLAAEGLADDINVALVTETEGMCNGDGCFVALNAGAASGWTRLEDGRIQLPLGACQPEPALGRLPVLDAAVVEVKAGCPRKTITLPTCGPWSASGDIDDPDARTPLALASGQAGPSAILVAGDALVWTNSGEVITEDTDGDGAAEVVGFTRGSVKVLPSGANEVSTLEALDGLAPRSLLVHEGALYWTEASALPGGGALRRAPLAGGSPEQIDLATPGYEPYRPEGLAIAGGAIFWTDFGEDRVGRLPVNPANPPIVLADQTRPYRIAAPSPQFACWTNEGTLAAQSGSVTCLSVTDEAAPTYTLQDIATGQATPRALAVTADAVIWANFEGGDIVRARRDGDAILEIAAIASGQGNPSGLAVDGGDVYWTNRGTGEVRVLRQGATDPELIATGQARPGEITVTADAIYWINEGAVGASTGVLMRRAK